MAIILPTQAIPASNKWEDQKILMLGAGGIGKSAFWACGPKTLFLEFEAGLSHLSVMRVPIRSWDDFLETGAALIKAKAAGNFPYDTIVLDTIDRWIVLINEEVISRGKKKFAKIADDINGIGDIPNGVGWFWASQLVEEYLAKLEALPAAVVGIAHLNVKRIEESPAAYDKETISIGGQMGTKLLHWSDHTIVVQSRFIGKELQRSLHTRPMQSREGKSRGDIVPDGMKWGNDTAENYGRFRALFN